MKWLRKLEPARVNAVIIAVFVLASALGVSFFTEDLKAAILGLISALLTLVGGEVTRGQVVPAAKVLAYVEDPQGYYPEIHSGEASVDPSQVSNNAIIEAVREGGRHRAEP